MNMKSQSSLKCYFYLFMCVVLCVGNVSVTFAASPPAYPTKSIEFVGPFAAGGGSEQTARILIPAIEKRWKQTINIVAKPGGNTVIGTAYVMRAAPDGYTTMQESPGSSAMQVMMKDLPFKVMDRTYICNILQIPGVLYVPANSPWKTLQDVVAAAKKDPSSFTWGSLGGSSTADLVMLQFFAAAGIDVAKTKPVTFPGAGPAMNAVAGGHVQFSGTTANTVMAFESGGLIRVLGVSSQKRLNVWPNVPTFKELGFPSVTALTYVGVSAPPGIPQYVVAAWEKVIQDVLNNDKDVVAMLEKNGQFPMFLRSSDYRKYIEEYSRDVMKFLKAPTAPAH